jgi:ubiquinone/menaquinone biosynthesis C-methylase UbiE
VTLYDERAAAAYERHRSADYSLIAALVDGAGLGPGSRVLEVGCGTGDYLAPIASTGASCTGVDPSEEMLAVARRRVPEARFFAARAESLPLPDESADFVYSVDVSHHIADLAAFFAEARRVLAAGGRICTATEDEEGMQQRLHAHYFPEALEADLARYPTPEQLSAAMQAAGFSEIELARFETPFEVRDAGPYRERALSSLELIPEDAFGRGLERLERDLERGALRGISRRLLAWGR